MPVETQPAARALVSCWQDGGRPPAVALAVSGGADSTALWVLAVTELVPRGVDCEALVVDHGWAVDSATTAHTTAERALAAGVRARVLTGHAPPGPNAEARARTLRHGLLDEARAGRPVLYAHTLDDQAETVLLGLARGSGARSLSGMRPIDGHRWRPFLGVRRSVLRAVCAAAGETPWEDPANHDPAYTRVRVREELLPAAEDILAGGVAEALARTAQLMRADDDALEEVAERWLASTAPTGAPAAQAQTTTAGPAAPLPLLDGPGVADLATQPTAVRTRVLRRLFRGAGITSPTAHHLAGADAVLCSGGSTAVPTPREATGRWLLVRAASGLALVPAPSRR